MDEADFRQGLRQRGLHDWLQQYLEDQEPVDEIDAELRRRETLLERADQPDLPLPQRRTLLNEATGLLAGLITRHPDHPAAMKWRLDLAVDHLERHAPDSFDAVLLYELAGRDAAVVREASSQAIRVLEELRQRTAAKWEAIGLLDEAALEELASSGATRPLQAVDAQAVLLLTWARLYHALAADTAELRPNEALAELWVQVTEHHGWTQLPPGHEFLRCQALAIATAAARGSGQHEQADGMARELIAALQRVSSPDQRQRLDRIALLAVLEQIRILRDRGQLPEAARLVQQAAEWARQTRPDDLRATLAVAFLHHSIQARAAGRLAGPETEHEPLRPLSPSPSLRLSHSSALAPLEELAGISPRHREALYAALAGALAGESVSAERTLFERQLLLGSAIHDAIETTDEPQAAAARERLKDAVAALQPAASPDSGGVSAWGRGEVLFLLGRGQHLLGNHRQAVDLLADLVEQLPDHDRALAAARHGAAIAETWWRQDVAGSSDARDGFIRIGRLLRRLEPQSPAGPRLQYLLGLALEQAGELEDAASAYASVPRDHPLRLHGRLGNARSLRNALFREAGPPARPDLADLARRALEAARQAADDVRGHRRSGAATPEAHPQEDDATLRDPGQDACLDADILLVLASILNHPAVGDPDEALSVIDELEKTASPCAPAAGPALRERIAALRKLNRFEEAREVVNRVIDTEPGQAGTVMAGLLDAMREEIVAAGDAGNATVVTEISVEAVQLAHQLLEWAGNREDRISPVDMLTIRVWQAWAKLMSGDPAGALAAYEDCNIPAEEKAVHPREAVSPAAALHVEITLGRAECLLALGRVDEALPLFAGVWQSATEHSPYWWRALTGSLDCHTRLGSDPVQIVQTIRQQRHLFPELGAPRWKRELEALEQANLERSTTADRPDNG